ncbi:MAG: 2-oxoacid:ferredoxin oxidoreductase subunit beta [Acidobacteriota bacterium]
MPTDAPALTFKDFQSDQEVRWCPGCGDYAILKAVQMVFPTLGIPKENFVVVSGIGCSSRFPYYMDTFGFHTIHGRAPAVASGLKMSRPELEVWVATGDGDAMSIGGNHLIHTLRRNVGLKILMFNNQIYGLTKGQYSPTSERGKRTVSTPVGSLDMPFNPLALALGAGATFVARSVDIFIPHLKGVLERAHQHQGSAFIEIFQNCNIFNDKAFVHLTEKTARTEEVLYLEQGQPMVYGKEKDRGIRLVGTRLEKIHLDDGLTADDCLVWDETDATLSFLASQMQAPEFPTPVGVIRAADRSVYEDDVNAQITQQIEAKGRGDLAAVVRGDDVWTVNDDRSVSR